MKPTQNEKVDQLIETLPLNIQEITTSLRKLLFEISDFTEEVKWGMPSYYKHSNICYLQPSKKHVNLGFYNGAGLKDPDNLLEGTGKQMRHIRIKKIEEIKPEQFKNLIEEAIDLQA
ncbi:DUF1801 domain-containing protein [Oceanobacillus bengalensis]|uniref:DUF1801 domain-containing protein n=1 Tax=Oceanobacillus bengalensis TaxID=1435466 RepID=A0A494Z496_9BACI|nr:DUF1801 domain-containing protein [Oceanobacillus bengalensis]RKQ17133.1 DUF1801 domain-containing protein [Oceanobacillus bengalensis]